MSSRIVSGWEDPYAGIAVSAVTSNVVDLTRTVAWSFSWRTTAGSVSTHTVQLSNASNTSKGDVPDASFSNGTTFGTGSPAVIEPQNLVRFARFLREPSGASVEIDVNRIEG